MFLGMGVVAAGFGAFYLLQMRVHKDDKQNCERDICSIVSPHRSCSRNAGILRHGEQSGNQTLAAPQQGPRAVGPAPRETASRPPSMPLPGSGDTRAEGLWATAMSVVLVRGPNVAAAGFNRPHVRTGQRSEPGPVGPGAPGQHAGADPAETQQLRNHLHQGTPACVHMPGCSWRCALNCDSAGWELCRLV